MRIDINVTNVHLLPTKNQNLDTIGYFSRSAESEIHVINGNCNNY